jgi:hypothetical protein
MTRWQCWKDSLQDLQQVSIPRCYRPKGLDTTTKAELHGFSDASKEAVGAVVYLKMWDKNGNVSVSFVYGQARLAPTHPVSIPRLELCGAVLVVEAVKKVLKEIDMEVTRVIYYTDLKVVLGYITNESKRFYVYVANRVQLIWSLSTPSQWRYVKSENNPADLATRGVKANKLMQSSWLPGPEFLKNDDTVSTPSDIAAPNEDDPEVRETVDTFATNVKANQEVGHGLGAKRFERFSSLLSLQRGIAILLEKIRRFKQHKKQSVGDQTADDQKHTSVDTRA